VGKGAGVVITHVDNKSKGFCRRGFAREVKECTRWKSRMGTYCIGLGDVVEKTTAIGVHIVASLWEN
jgi:hypothetical protein